MKQAKYLFPKDYMADPSAHVSKRRLISNVRTIFMLAVFTVIWGAFMSIGFGVNIFSVIIFVIFLVYAVWLFVRAAKARRAVQSLPDAHLDEAEIHTEKRIGRRFGIIFSIEIVLIIAAGTLFGNSIIGNPYYITPVIALIVGTHLFPLSALFHVRLYIIFGLIMVTVAIIAIILIAMGLIINIAIGVCCLVAAFCVAIMATNLLRFVNKSLKIV